MADDSVFPPKVDDEPEAAEEPKTGPVYAGEAVKVGKEKQPVTVKHRKDVGRLKLADGREVFEKDVQRA